MHNLNKSPANFYPVSQSNEDCFLQLSQITCQFDDKTILNNLHLQLPRGSFCCLLGNSGSGKTTLLRIIAGLQGCQQGQIKLDGRTIMLQGKANLPPHQRGIGMVFQDYALFPHLSVRDNLLFAIHKCTKITAQNLLDRLLSLVNLQGFEHQFPHQLSGGQQQRIALARALANHPQLMLLDEPFSNLDQEQRLNMARQVKKILRQQHISTLMVTHDQKEAMMIADYVGIMRHGQIIQWDTPYNLYHRPTSAAVAEMIGEGQWLPAMIASGQSILTPIGEVQSDRWLFCRAIQCCRKDTKQKLYIRTEDVEIVRMNNNETTDTEKSVKVRVEEQNFIGFATVCYVQILNTIAPFEEPLQLSIPLLCRDPDIHVGDTVNLHFCINEPILFPQSVSSKKDCPAFT